MIKGIRLAPKGEVKFKITMELDENSILKVHAKEVNGDLVRIKIILYLKLKK